MTRRTKCLKWPLSLKYEVKKKFGKIFSLSWPLMTSEVKQHLFSKMCRSRAFQNGMTLEYWMKIEASGPPEAQTFSVNLDNSETQIWGVLDISIFIQYASDIPFWKALDLHILENKCCLTSEVIRGH